MIACRTTVAPAGAFFVYVEERDALDPSLFTASTPRAAKLHMRLGERLSGWVAANRRAQIDADARLDLPGIGESFRSAVSFRSSTMTHSWE